MLKKKILGGLLLSRQFPYFFSSARLPSPLSIDCSSSTFLSLFSLLSLFPLSDHLSHLQRSFFQNPRNQKSLRSLSLPLSPTLVHLLQDQAPKPRLASTLSCRISPTSAGTRYSTYRNPLRSFASTLHLRFAYLSRALRTCATEAFSDFGRYPLPY